MICAGIPLTEGGTAQQVAECGFRKSGLGRSTDPPERGQSVRHGRGGVPSLKTVASCGLLREKGIWWDALFSLQSHRFFSWIRSKDVGRNIRPRHFSCCAFILSQIGYELNRVDRRCNAGSIVSLAPAAGSFKVDRIDDWETRMQREDAGCIDVTDLCINI